MSVVGEANVIVRPIVTGFREQVAASVSSQLGGAKAVPLPVQPTITPAAAAKFKGEVGGLRGALIGAGQFGASRALGISGLAAGLFAFAIAGEKAVKSAATLETELNVFQQVSGATADQMARVRDESRALGADLSLPAVSAGDAAATMTELAKAGLSVNDVLKGTKGTLELAAAAQLDFATASELSANALNSFELPGRDAIKVADLLAGAAQAAQGNIADFGNALTQSAAVAHQAGLSIGETVTFLTEFAKAGIQSSDAGTSLRVALLRLIAPTKEAQAIFNALGVNLKDFQAGRIRAPEFFLQLQQALAPLRVETRNTALATIFGTDAIRVASVAVRDAGQQYADLARQTGRAGSAQDAAAARTKGLAGAFQGLSSNIETFGTDVGTVALPAMTQLTKGASALVTQLDKADTKLIDIITKLANVKVPGTGGKTFGDTLAAGFKAAGSDALNAVPGVQTLRQEVELVQKIAAQFADKPIFAPPKVGAGGTDVFGIKGFLASAPNPLADPQLEKAMAEAGRKAARAFTKAAGTEITKNEQSVIDAAKQTVRDAQSAFRDVVAEGARAIEEAAVSAKQNLASIGQTLAQQVTDILDSGPLAQRIKALQENLKKSQDALQAQTLGRSLRDAQEALKRAEAQIAGGPGNKSAAQQAGERQFLRPFQEGVKDAQAALAEFNTQGTIDSLTQRLANQKAQLQKTLNDLIAKFNAGLLSAPQVNARVAALLQKNVGPMAKAGAAQGFAFRQAFAAEVAALQAQLAAIIGGPGTKKTGAEPTIVSPADAAKTAAGNVAAAQRSVKDAIVALHKTEQDAVKATTQPGGTNDLLKQIRNELKGKPAKPSSTAKPPTARGARTGGR